MRIYFVAASIVLFLSACSALRIDRPLQVASGLTSHLVCSGTFITGLDPDRVYAETIRPMRGVGLFEWALTYEVDRQHRQVTTSVAGAFTSRAVYRDGMGCLLLAQDEANDGFDAKPIEPGAPEAAPPFGSHLPDIAGPAVVAASDGKLKAAVNRAFVEPQQPPFHNTKAVIVLRDGKIVAERYAEGYGTETRQPAWSISKSVINALVGILVKQRRLTLDAPAAVPAWAGADDPRRAITIDHLLRQTSGLNFVQDNSGFDPDSHMKFIERDMAGFADTAELVVPPGSRWTYSDANFLRLSRMVRDASGGSAADVLRFARRELFEPLGMRHVTLEFDAAGTPIGSTFMYASARDWARFGLLYLNDGMVGEKRILPEGWVRYSSSPTLDTGYGAGFFTNLGTGNVPQWGVPWGMPKVPRDAFFARGYMGQYVVVVPSERLVVVRLGVSHVRGDDVESTERLVAAVVAALQGK